MKVFIDKDEYYPFRFLIEKTKFTLPSIEITPKEYMRYLQVMDDLEELQAWIENLENGHESA